MDTGEVEDREVPDREVPDREVYAPWLYRDLVRKAVHRFKFSGSTQYARTFGAVMAQCVRSDGYDAVAWVPCSFLRRLKRRFDQSRLLTVHIARALDKPLVPLLVRKRHGQAQYRAKDARERGENVKRAFAVREKRLKDLPADARILLIDDIYTTGSTSRECKRVILEAGAKNVTLLVIAKRK
jgi:ComF family protein